MSDRPEPKQPSTTSRRRTSASPPPPGPATGNIYVPQRPLGITMIAVLNFVVACLLLVVVVLSVVNASSGDYSLACVALLPMMIGIGLGISLWRMLPWARNTAILVYAFYALSALVNILSRPITVADIASIVIPAAIVLYLIQPSVRDAFESNARP